MKERFRGKYHRRPELVMGIETQWGKWHDYVLSAM